MKQRQDAHSIGLRALVVGLLFVAANAYRVGIASEVWYAVYTLVSPFSNAVFSLAVLLALNAVLKRATPRFAFGFVRRRNKRHQDLRKPIKPRKMRRAP